MTIRASRDVTFKPLDEEPLLSTVYNIEVCAVGIEYPLSTGPATFTTEDLLEAVASQQDPAIVPPRVWLGHPDDDRFHAGRATPAGSAEPALGKLVNMRVEDEGMTLVADAVGVPTWLAKILSSAFPSRSIEGFQEATTATGRTWGLVVTDLALLGVTWPGVSTLEDLQALYSEDGPEGVDVKEDDQMTIAAGRSVEGQVDLDDIRRAFGKAVEAGQFEDIKWPWIRAVLLDPNELIIDDDASGEIFRLPYTPDEKDGATFGELKQVKINYVNASQQKDGAMRAAATAGLTVGREVAVIYASREESRIHNDQEVTMTPEELRASLGLPTDATDDQVKSKITELQAAVDNPSPDQVPAQPESPAHGPGSPPDPAPPREAPTQADPEEREVGERNTTDDVNAAMETLKKHGLVGVPAQAWTQQQATVQSLAAKHEEDGKSHRQSIVVSALRAGKIFPSQREYYAQKVEDPNTRDTFLHLLTASVADGGLMENTVPVHARSVDAGDVSLTAEAYPSAWLPEVAQPKSASGEPITVER
jgi:hypothetical protein